MATKSSIIQARRRGGKAKSIAKAAAARANGKLGGRPRNADRMAKPKLFLGHFGFDSTKSGSKETEDGRFTLIVHASHINDAIREFRRFLKRPGSPVWLDGVSEIFLLSCSEIRQIPAAGFMPFYERIMRDQANECLSGISIANVGASSNEAVAYGSTRSQAFVKLQQPTVREPQNEAR